MNMMTLNAESLTKIVGSPVDDITVLIAKNDVANLDSQTISEILGVERVEVEEIQATQLYKDIRLVLGAEYAKQSVEADFSWDALESLALNKLVTHMNGARSVDPELALKMAAVANKASRRMAATTNKVLDPSAGGQRVALSLTSRIVRKLSERGEQSVEETRQISVMDGSATNPSFEDIDRLLGVSQRPRIAENMAIHTHDTEFSIDDITLGGK